MCRPSQTSGGGARSKISSSIPGQYLPGVWAGPE